MGDPMKHHLFLIFLILILIVTSCDKKFDDNTIAYVDGEKYTLEDLSDYYSADYLKGVSANVIKERVTDYINMIVASQYLKETGRFDDYLLKYKIQVKKAREYAQALYDHEVFKKLIDDETYDELYNRIKSQKLTYHILITYKNPRNPDVERTDKEAFVLINQIRRRAKPENFESLATEYSEDPVTRNKGGNLGWVRAGQMIAAFDSALFATKAGQISPPFKTSYGYHIIFPKQERSLAVKSREEEMPRLKVLARKLWPERFLERQQEYIDSLTQENPLTLYPSGIESFYSVFDSLMSQRKNVFETLLDMPDTFLLAEYPGVKIGKDWVVDYMAFFLDHEKFPRFKSVEDLTAFVQDNHILDLLVRTGSRLDVVKGENFQRKINRYILKTAHAYYYSVVIYEGIDPTEDDLARYYVRHKSNYMMPKQVLVQEVLVSDSLLAREIHNKLMEGADFASLAEKYTERPVGKRNRGLLDPFHKGQYGEMGKKAFEMKPGDLSEPILLKDGRFSIIQVIEFYPEAPMAYDTVKKKVVQDYMREKQSEAKENAFLTLYEKYDVQINPLYKK
jgi:parvulin-like peptidyl-prolyl isomerase